MGSGASIPADKHIVIIGGGYAGANLCALLNKQKANFTLVDPKDCFHHNVATPRAMVIKDYCKKTVISYKDTYGDSFKQGKVTSITPSAKRITLDSGEELTYDVLVIATGSTYGFPAKTEATQTSDILEQYNNFAEKLSNATNITLVGGGPVGIEIAAEIATETSGKTVTLVHPSEALLHPDLTSKGQTELKKILTSLGVKFVLGEKVTNLDEALSGETTSVTTDKGTTIDTDVCIKCFGVKVASDAYSSSLGNSTEENGSIKVNSYFEVEGYEDIYAIGDCTNFKENKLAYLANEHAKLLHQNLSNRYKEKSMKPYKPDQSPSLAAVSLGRNHGFAQSKGGTIFPEFVVKKLKSSDMMCGDQWKMMAQKMPSV